MFSNDVLHDAICKCHSRNKNPNKCQMQCNANAMFSFVFLFLFQFLLRFICPKSSREWEQFMLSVAITSPSRSQSLASLSLQSLGRRVRKSSPILHITKSSPPGLSLPWSSKRECRGRILATTLLLQRTGLEWTSKPLRLTLLTYLKHQRN